MVQRIPLLADVGDQQVTVELDGTPYVLRFAWNSRFGLYVWFIGLTDGTELISGRAVVANYPLNASVVSSSLPTGALVLVREAGDAEYPTYGSLGKDFQLYYVPYEADSTLAFTIDVNPIVQEL